MLHPTARLLQEIKQSPEQMRSLALETIKVQNKCTHWPLRQSMKSNTPPVKRSSLETINVNYPADQCPQVFTDGSYVECQANVGAGVYSELFSVYAAAGHNRSALFLRSSGT
ncbi:unnamed protein product [Rodentolepis nana]|uniref:Uncharacterized protein n=1 Tax=Rodentolepis nana TaxID=102285 RepID=A0A0R3TBL9_RODNA|nr:unnamed protein product [Rodentolepis nana]